MQLDNAYLLVMGAHLPHWVEFEITRLPSGALDCQVAADDPESTKGLVVMSVEGLRTQLHCGTLGVRPRHPGMQTKEPVMGNKHRPTFEVQAVSDDSVQLHAVLVEVFTDWYKDMDEPVEAARDLADEVIADVRAEEMTLLQASDERSAVLAPA